MNICITIVLLVSTGVQVTLCDEDSCSRFGCEYKMMRKIVQLENEQEVLKKYIAQGGTPAPPVSPEVRRLEGKVRQLEEHNLELSSSLSNVKRQIQVLQQEGDQRPETTYVRWGHTDCPTNGTKIVYSGYMGGTLNSQASGPQNPLCLPKDPDWAHYDSTVQDGGKVYGAEYRFGGHTDLAQSFFKKATRGHEAPCAVCLSSSTTVLMIPAKRECGEGWKKEYDGYLATGYNLDTSSVDYFCLDKDPQLLGTSKEIEGVRIHLVESICGPLVCPPYHNGRELTCVVCSQ